MPAGAIGKLFYGFVSIPAIINSLKLGRSNHAITYTCIEQIWVLNGDCSMKGIRLKPLIPLDGDSATIRNFGQNDTNRSRNGKSAVLA